MFKEIILEVRDGIGIITLNRPEKLNAGTDQMRSEMTQALDELESNNKIRVAILTGAGHVFSVGGDRKTIAAGNPSDALAAMERLANFKKPLIAAIERYALGFGAQTMLLCDIIIAAEGTRISFMGALAGVICTAALNYLPLQIGRAKALELMLTGKQIDADEALRIGLINKVVPSAKLMDTAFEVAEMIERAAPISARLTKEGVACNLRKIGDMDFLKRALAEIEVSEDRQEAARAFFETREPRWTGR